MSRNEQLIRQHKLLQLLEQTRIGRTLDELRERNGEGAGPAVAARQDGQARPGSAAHRGLRHRKPAPAARQGVAAGTEGPRQAYRIQASVTELIALSIGRDLLYPLAGTPFWQAIETFWNKLKDELPASVWKHYEAYRQVLYVRGMPAKSYERQHGVLAHDPPGDPRAADRAGRVSAAGPGPAAAEDRAVRGRVLSRQPVHRRRGARTAAGRRSGFAISSSIAFCGQRPLDAFFQRPADFDLEAHLGQGIGIFSGGKARDFKIRISPRGARWVQEDPWHADQQVEPQADGGIVLTVPAHHDLEIIPRVLALGSEAEVLAPPSCRKAIAAIVRQMAERYRDVE